MVGSGTPAATPAAAAAATCRMPIAKTEGHSQPEDRQESQDGIMQQNRGISRGSSGSSRVCSRLTRFSAPMPPTLCSL